MENRDKFLTSDGRPITQSLFLELGYNDEAIYTLKDFNHTYKGKEYLSIKAAYLEMSDPTEYDFATKYFLNWKHWQRICANKAIRIHIDEWREELEMKLRSRAVKLTIAQAEGGSYQAAKWLADKGWTKREAGRPSKAEVEGERKFLAKVDEQYGADIVRLRQG